MKYKNNLFIKIIPAGFVFVMALSNCRQKTTEEVVVCLGNHQKH